MTRRPRITFDCPRWPTCGCPDGAVHPDCPALEWMLESLRHRAETEIRFAKIRRRVHLAAAVAIAGIASCVIFYLAWSI